MHEAWPALPYAAWKETRDTLHRWVQIVGKIRLARTPLQNHWWNVSLGLTARGLSTGPMADGDRAFEIDFDFLDHMLHLRTSDGAARALPLAPRSVAEFWRDLFAGLAALGIDVSVSDLPTEIEADPIPFREDHLHASYDADYARRWFRAVLRTELVLQRYLTGFVGKASPIQLFWGTFDLAQTRFSGRPTPPRPGADSILRESYTHELASCGFWPGDPHVPMAAFYAYAAPAPSGYDEWPIQPDGAFFDEAAGLFLLPYEQVRRAEDPDATLLRFFDTAYEAAAELGEWDRATLERPATELPLPRHSPLNEPEAHRP